MNSKFKMVIRNIGYTFTSNIMSLLISVALTLVVPKLLGVKEYAYWQLYAFYASYVGFFHFGWIDGIYLKIGGQEYEDLDYRNLRNQFWLLNIMEVVIAGGVALFAYFFLADGMKSLILMYTALCGVITIAKTFILFILQSTNRIKEYARYTRYDRFIYFVLVMGYIFLGGRNVQFLIMSDIVSRFVVLLMCMKSCRELVIPPTAKLSEVKTDIVDNIRIGSKLMFANVASMLILGIIRKGIESQWSIEVFGKMSLTLSVSNLLLTFINAIGVVMFPLLRKLDKAKLTSFYTTIRTPLMLFLYGCLFLFYPMRLILAMWLPKYADSLVYMAILFPMFIYESKMVLLINTYLKTLRREKVVLYVNLISVGFSILFTILFAYVWHNLFFTVVSIVLVIAIRCNLAEKELSKALGTNFKWDVLAESLLTIVFIIVSYYLPTMAAITVYLCVYLGYVAVNWRKLKKSIGEIRLLSSK